MSRMTPGREWWTWVPPTATLRNGPRPSRISRVIVRVDANVTTKETKHSISGSLPAAITSRCHHESMTLTLGARTGARDRSDPGRYCRLMCDDHEHSAADAAWTAPRAAEGPAVDPVTLPE